MPQGLLPFTTDHPHKSIIENQPGCTTRMKRRFFYLLDSNPRKLKTLSIILLGICLIFYITFFVFLNNDIIEEEVPNAILPESLLEKRLDFEAVTIDQICSTQASICYSVVDKKTHRGVERHLLFDNGLPEESDTAILLIPPKGESFDTSDTRIWNIDHKKLTAQYAAGMFIAPFMVSVLPIKGTGDNKSLLEIGLGGGSLNMALHLARPELNITVVEKDPVIVQISEKWFGVKSDKKHKILAADGVEFIAQIAKTDYKYDVILLDACDENVDAPCPASPFLENQSIQDLKEALSPTGVLVVNILTHEEDETNPVFGRKSIEAFTKVFPTCLQLKMTLETNRILVCQPQTVGDSEEQVKFYNSRLKAAIASLKLQYILDKITVSQTI